jgi:hypothetical protein
VWGVGHGKIVCRLLVVAAAQLATYPCTEFAE